MNMNNVPTKILRTTGIIFATLFFALFSLYISLCIYVKSKETIIDESFLENNADVRLTEEQLKIASFILTKKKNPEFEKNLLIKDIFSLKNKIAENVASFFIDSHSMSSADYRFRVLATGRRLVRKADYRTCYDFYFSRLYFGNGIYGLKNASMKYYGKDYKTLNSSEFIGLCLISCNPTYFDFYTHKKRLNDKTDEIFKEFFQKPDNQVLVNNSIL